MGGNLPHIDKYDLHHAWIEWSAWKRTPTKGQAAASAEFWYGFDQMHKDAYDEGYNAAMAAMKAES